MFEMFKKPEQENETETPNEAQNENTRETPNETEYITPENPEPEPCQITETNSLAQLEELTKEEQTLLEEKAQLINMEVNLWQKIAEEVEAKKQRIAGLRQEIPELRKKCDALAEALNLPLSQ
jgi:predicted RNase H-like nuclease (RuvC/YqgF family)